MTCESMMACSPTAECCSNCMRAEGWPNAPGPGTRQRIFVCSTPGQESRKLAIWFGSEIGATASGKDFLVAGNRAEMTQQLRRVLTEPGLAAALVEHGWQTIRNCHTCAHRVNELLAIHDEVRHGRKTPAARLKPRKTGRRELAQP